MHAWMYVYVCMCVCDKAHGMNHGRANWACSQYTCCVGVLPQIHSKGRLCVCMWSTGITHYMGAYTQSHNCALGGHKATLSFLHFYRLDLGKLLWEAETTTLFQRRTAATSCSALTKSSSFIFVHLSLFFFRCQDTVEISALWNAASWIQLKDGKKKRAGTG